MELRDEAPAAGQAPSKVRQTADMGEGRGTLPSATDRQKSERGKDTKRHPRRDGRSDAAENFAGRETRPRRRREASKGKIYKFEKRGWKELDADGVEGLEDEISGDEKDRDEDVPCREAVKRHAPSHPRNPHAVSSVCHTSGRSALLSGQMKQSDLWGFVHLIVLIFVANNCHEIFSNILQYGILVRWRPALRVARENSVFLCAVTLMCALVTMCYFFEERRGRAFKARCANSARFTATAVCAASPQSSFPAADFEGSISNSNSPQISLTASQSTNAFPPLSSPAVATAAAASHSPGPSKSLQTSEQVRYSYSSLPHNRAAVSPGAAALRANSVWARSTAAPDHRSNSSTTPSPGKPVVHATGPQKPDETGDTENHAAISTAIDTGNVLKSYARHCTDSRAQDARASPRVRLSPMVATNGCVSAFRQRAMSEPLTGLLSMTTSFQGDVDQASETGSLSDFDYEDTAKAGVAESNKENGFPQEAAKRPGEVGEEGGEDEEVGQELEEDGERKKNEELRLAAKLALKLRSSDDFGFLTSKHRMLLERATKMAEEHVEFLHALKATGCVVLTLVVPYLVVSYSSLEPVSSVAILLLSLTWCMKMFSFHHTLHDVRMIMLQGETSFADVCPHPEEASACALYPQNLTLKHFWTFIAMPTLCFQFTYPRNERRRWGVVLKTSFQLLLSCIMMKILVEQYMSVTLAHTFDMSFEPNTPWRAGKITMHFLERLLKLSIPTLYTWLLMFLSFFHFWMILLAELTRFQDTCFYEAWWNATGFADYWRKWNLPVHNFCSRHIYKPLVARGVNRFVAAQVVFILSALAHEFLVVAPLKLGFTGLVFTAFALQTPLALITDARLSKSQPTLGNIIFWIVFCFTGQPVGILIFYWLRYRSQQLTSINVAGVDFDLATWVRAAPIEGSL